MKSNVSLALHYNVMATHVFLSCIVASRRAMSGSLNSRTVRNGPRQFATVRDSARHCATVVKERDGSRRLATAR